MKEQLRIQFRSRKNANSTSTSNVIKSKKIAADVTTAFIPFEEAVFEPTKVEKPVRKSGRIATKTMKQSVLNLKAIDTEKNNIKLQKRKSDTLPVETTKKHKTTHSLKEDNREKETTPIESEVKNAQLQQEKDVLIEEIETKAVETPCKKNMVVEENEIVNEEIVTNKVKTQENEIISKKTEIVETEKSLEMSEIVETEKTVGKQEIVETKKTVVESEKTIVEQFKDNEVNFFNTNLEKEKSIIANDYDEEINNDLTPKELTLPPSESLTPPMQLETSSAPYKTYRTKADKLRIEEEKTTLEKVRKALDIVITDRMARNKPTLYHQIEPVLRNSTRKSITMSHVCKIMYIASNLYTIEAKELRDYGGKVSEAIAIQFAKEWQVPLSGKDLHKRSDILKDGLDSFFKTHKEHDATVPEVKLPTLSSLVSDKKDWKDNHNIPAGVRALLETHQKISEAEEESKKPKPKPVGTVKDRMAALRARIGKKK